MKYAIIKTPTGLQLISECFGSWDGLNIIKTGEFTGDQQATVWFDQVISLDTSIKKQKSQRAYYNARIAFNLAFVASLILLYFLTKIGVL